MKARVVFSNIGYQGDDGRRLSAKSGEVVELSKEEFDRLSDLGAVTTFAGGGRPPVPPREEPAAEAVEEEPKPKRRSTKRSGNR